MKQFYIGLLAAGMLGWGFMLLKRPNQAVGIEKKVQAEYAPVAVLELFTSEGCSSCPPADILLPQLAKDNAAVIPLSFHVDYWNRLGWTDPFSSSTYSERQRQYSRQLHLESVYTPQLVVNGTYELVGSSRGRAEAAIHKALKEKAIVKISVSDLKLKNNRVFFKAIPEGKFANADLVAVLIQKTATVNVKAGENRGARLTHTNIVRAFEKENASAATAFNLLIPVDLADWQLLVLAQQKTDLKIIGAVVVNHP